LLCIPSRLLSSGYGDSGGPNFTTINGTMLLVGDTITGDTPCYATMWRTGPTPRPRVRSSRRS
jgi:hypothetical protein